MIKHKLEYVLNPKARQEGAKELRDCIFQFCFELKLYRGSLGTFGLVPCFCLVNIPLLRERNIMNLVL